MNEDSTGFMIAPLRTALHVYGWNLAALLSGQGHGKDSKLQPGGCENQDDEEGPAPARHGGPQQGRSQKRPRQGCVLQSAGRGPRVGPALPAESTLTPKGLLCRFLLRNPHRASKRPRIPRLGEVRCPPDAGDRPTKSLTAPGWADSPACCGCATSCRDRWSGRW